MKEIMEDDPEETALGIGGAWALAKEEHSSPSEMGREVLT